MSKQEQSRVVIIGGGIMGLCTAYYLATSNKCSSITIVEEGEIAGGASGRAAGFLARDWHGAATRSLGKLSYDLHTKLARRLDGESHYGYRPVASLSMHVQRGCGDIPEEGNKARPLTDNWIDYQNASDVDEIDDGKATAQIHPKQFCETLLQECLSLGVAIVRAKAESFQDDCSEVRFADNDTLKADSIVLCCGPWTGTVAKELFNAQIDVQDLPGHSLVIRTNAPLPPVAIFASLSAPDATDSPELFSRPDGTVYIAGENSGAPLPPGTAKVSMDDSSLDRLFTACKLISPALGKGKIEQRSLCYRPVTSSRRGFPYLCPLPTKTRVKTFVCAGHGPWGISLGPGSGKVMSELILDGKATSASGPWQTALN